MTSLFATAAAMAVGNVAIYAFWCREETHR